MGINDEKNGYAVYNRAFVKDGISHLEHLLTEKIYTIKPEHFTQKILFPVQ